MADRDLPSSIRGVLRRLKVKEIKHLPDAELLDRYVSSRDESAFTALVGRHGPTVLSVCRRVLRGHDVDDVFQATFLALAKEAATIRRRQSLGTWLYEVAYHAALRAKARRARHQLVEQAAATSEGAVADDEVVYRDVQQVLDEELHQLPERLRKPLVMVHLLGRVQVDAARELGITDRALRKRLRIGRERLRSGLTRRGVTLTAAALVVVLDQAATAGPVAPGLLGPTVESVLAYAAGHTAAVPASTVSLAMAGVGGWLAGRFKLIALVAVPVLATLVITASALTPFGSRAPQPADDPAAPAIAPIAVLEGPTTVLTGRVLGPDGRPVPNASVTALIRRPWQAADRGQTDEVVARATADADGRYQVTVPTRFPSWTRNRRVTLLAHAEGRPPVTGEIAVGGRNDPTDLRMTGSASAIGRLVAPDGKPAEGVRLAVVRLGRAAWEAPQGGATAMPPVPAGWPADVVTNAAGEFRFEGLPAGESLWLQVRDDRYALTTFPATATSAGANAPATSSEPVTLAPPRLLAGRITAADTGRPLAGARVAVIVGPDRQAIDYYTALAASILPDAGASRGGQGPAPAEVAGRTDADGRYRLRLPPGPSYQVYVYPPEGSSYLAWSWSVNWAEGETTRERTAALPVGVEVRGRVLEEDGRPVDGACVAWQRDDSESSKEPKMLPGKFPSAQAPVLLFSDTATITGADGRFRMVVCDKPVILRVFGPTADFRLCDYTYQRCPQCGKDHLRLGENARVHVDPTVIGPAPIRVTLRRGFTLTGRTVGPDGEPIREGVAFCRTISQPLRKPAPRPMPIRDGKFEIGGCVPGRIYPVLFLDLERGLANVAEFRIGAAEIPTPHPPGRAVLVPIPDGPITARTFGQVGAPVVVSLSRCGSATIRLVDAAGRPLAGQRPSVWFWLSDDRPIDSAIAPGDGPWSNPIDASWVDPWHYISGPVTNAEGFVILPNLVPGLHYHVFFSDLGGRTVDTAPFRVQSGESLRLPDLIAPPEPGDEGHAQQPNQAVPKEVEAPPRK